MFKTLIFQCAFLLCLFQNEVVVAEKVQNLSNTLNKVEDLIQDGNWIAAEQIFELTEYHIHSNYTNTEKVKFYNEWGRQLFNHGYYSDGFRQYKKAEVLLNAQTDTVLTARLFLNIGNSHFYLGDKEKSKEYHQKSLKLLPFFKSECIDEAYIWMNIGVLRFMEDGDSVAYYLHKAEDIASRFKDYKLSSNIHLNLGNHYGLQQLNTLAQKHYNFAVNFAQKTTDLRYINKVKARSLSMSLYLNDSIEVANRLLAFSKNMKADEQWEAYSISQQQLSLYYQSHNNYKLALEASKESLSTEKKLSKKHLKEFSTSYASKIETIKKNNLNIIALKNLEIEQSNYKKYALIGLCIFLLVLVFMVIVIIKRKMNFITLVEEKLSLQNEEIKLKKALELKNQELLANTLKLTENNKALERTVSQLKKIKHNSNSATEITDLLSELKLRSTEVSWKEFDLKFTQNNTDFIKALLAEYPNLTTNEKRLACFIKLNLSTKEISSITKQSTNSIDVGKSRLRKKMKLQPNETLENKIINI